MGDIGFSTTFEALTSKPPFPWQEAMYAEFAEGRFPPTAALPTGLGKTSVIAVWLIALANHPDRVPRRLVYVVNRRTVVDQSTAFTEQLRARLLSDARLAGRLSGLAAAADTPLAVSTLRGQFADNGEWSKDPARPAVVVGTIDLIGSRLLFSGYRAGFKTRPLFAGFLGQDALLVHDEAHLEPAFQELLTAIHTEQRHRRDFRPLHVLALTATARAGGEPFTLTDRDSANAVVQQRLHAKKRIALHPVEDEKKVAPAIIDLALAHKHSGQAVLVFVRTIESVNAVLKGLVGKGKVPAKSVTALTGTMRGLERDRMADGDAVFARFLPEPPAGQTRKAEPAAGTEYLVCTAAGEVGVDISADHLVCDLTPFDSMAQRFGRVNRYGAGDAHIDVVHETEPNDRKKDDPFDQRRWLTLELLNDLKGDASPAALSGLPSDKAQAAFTPPPEVLPASDILFDSWAMTTIRGPLPGRPPVADWLHGIAEWQPPETYVAWRQEVGELRRRSDSDEARKEFEEYAEGLLEDYPLKPHELLRDRTDRVFKHLESLTDDNADQPAWVIDTDDTLQVTSLGELVAAGKDRLNGRTLVLPPSVGGLTRSGTLGTGEPPERFDVADEWRDEAGRPRRLRVWDEEPPPAGMRLIRTIELGRPDEAAGDSDEDSPPKRVWRWYVRPRSADDDGSRSARKEQLLQPHLDSAERIGQRIATKLGLSPALIEAVGLAARWHDRGKHRTVWQRSIGNTAYPERVLAKSAGGMLTAELNHYRHEFGSLVEAHGDAEVRGHPERDLILHLIAAHHGRSRPHFTADEVFDPQHEDARCAEVAREVPRRYARLQRRFGRWGLAYLESLLRAADYLASEIAP
jgi:CRISPR-associated endonuclease/helicase Cas3